MAQQAAGGPKRRESRHLPSRGFALNGEPIQSTNTLILELWARIPRAGCGENVRAISTVIHRSKRAAAGIARRKAVALGGRLADVLMEVAAQLVSRDEFL